MNDCIFININKDEYINPLMLTNDISCKVFPLIFIHHTVELDSSLLLFHRSSKEVRESQSLVFCIYQYPYVRWVKKKNSTK